MGDPIYDISFPHLGIFIRNLPGSFRIFGFEVAYYGVLIAIGVFLAVLLCMRRAGKTGQNPGDYLDLAIFGVLSAIIGARIYYVLFSLDYYLKDPIQILNIRNGGLAIYGGIIGGFLAGFFVCRFKKISFLQVLDTVCPTIALGQAIGRWGNFFNREAYGGYTDSLFAMQIRLGSASGVLNDEIMDHLVSVNGTDYIQVHPTFLYESFWCFVLFLLLILFRRYQQYHGEVLLWYLGGYGVERMIVEGLRTDSLRIGSTGIAVSQVLSIGLVIVSLILLIRNRNRLHHHMGQSQNQSTKENDNGI
ncbi:MAG: prolipoprotein diacylglyceryl transferase [Parasporobacterium sp.]|nr:prolipoprotein diacylglyceryl transferase [Parasporobacterium sp.]